jgi:carbonic anhydrase/acetyltransferase-like protein (isoleucine patch superfamily)
MGDFLHSSEMKSQTIAAVLATVIGLVAVYAFAYVFVGDTYKSDRRVERIEVPKAPVVQAMPIVKGPVVRDLPLPEK